MRNILHGFMYYSAWSRLVVLFGGVRQPLRSAPFLDEGTGYENVEHHSVFVLSASCSHILLSSLLCYHLLFFWKHK